MLDQDVFLIVLNRPFTISLYKKLFYLSTLVVAGDGGANRIFTLF